MPPEISGMPETSSMIEWIAGAGVVFLMGIVCWLLMRTIPSAFDKVDALGKRFEESHEKNTNKVVGAIEKLTSEVRDGQRHRVN